MQTEGGMNLLCLRDASIKSHLADGMCDECANCELDIRTVTKAIKMLFELGKHYSEVSLMLWFCL